MRRARLAESTLRLVRAAVTVEEPSPATGPRSGRSPGPSGRVGLRREWAWPWASLGSDHRQRDLVMIARRFGQAVCHGVDASISCRCSGINVTTRCNSGSGPGTWTRPVRGATGSSKVMRRHTIDAPLRGARGPSRAPRDEVRREQSAVGLDEEIDASWSTAVARDVSEDALRVAAANGDGIDVCRSRVSASVHRLSLTCCRHPDQGRCSECG